MNLLLISGRKHLILMGISLLGPGATIKQEKVGFMT